MSWNFMIAGRNKDAVKAALRAEQNVPTPFKDALCGLIDSLYAPQGFFIKSAGHIDGGTGNGTFEINPYGLKVTE